MKGNNSIISKIENIVIGKASTYLTIAEYDYIKSLINSNDEDLFFVENISTDLKSLLEDSEMYYGFNENEIKSFLTSVQELQYTFNYVDMATQDNGEFNHTFKPYALRKI